MLPPCMVTASDPPLNPVCYNCHRYLVCVELSILFVQSFPFIGPTNSFSVMPKSLLSEQSIQRCVL